MTVSTKLKVKAVPGSSRSRIVGWLGDALKVSVTAPPERGKANAAIEEVIAASLDIRPRCVKVVAGHRSAHKVVEITGLSLSDIQSRIPESPGSDLSRSADAS